MCFEGNVFSVVYLINWDVYRLLHRDVHRVGLGDGDLHVLRHGHRHGVRDRHAYLLDNCHVVRLGVLGVRVAFGLPFVGGARGGSRGQEKDGCCFL